MTSQDHYDTLGVGMGASPREIRLAYLRASLEAHPDHGGSHSKMVAVNEAWSALSIQSSTSDTSDGGGLDERSTEYASEGGWSSDTGSGSSFNHDDESYDLMDRYYDYGDLDETGGSYKIQLVDGTEISLEEHERFCRCVSGGRISDGCCLDGSSDESSETESVEQDLA